MELNRGRCAKVTKRKGNTAGKGGREDRRWQKRAGEGRGRERRGG